MPLPVLAYIGPGAGFAFLGSFLSLIASFVLTALSFLFWPFRMAWVLARRRSGLRHARVRRIVFLGLDGLDPRLTERFLSEGKLPNLARLRQQGGFHRLRTTFPALSPVAWSTFATGVSPAKHNIFDFLNRSLFSYAPELSSCKIRRSARALAIGRRRIPLARPTIELRRKSRSFWTILGERSIPTTILRVPVTFPPEEFPGRLLSAASVPDLRGAQSSYSLFSVRPAARPSAADAGQTFPLRKNGAYLEGALEGPPNDLAADAAPLTLPFRIALTGAASATLEIAGQSHLLRLGEYSSWIGLPFRAAPGVRVHGLARFLITQIAPDFSLYVTPLQIDPESPALPISHPPYYAAALARLIGPFATAGMAEDTWALNEGAIDESAFLDQAYSILAEREAQFEHALAHTRRGVVACVFDTSDRIQHMFFRRLDDPASPHRDAIERLYRRMDLLVGKTLARLDPRDLLLVLSDHGFCAFRRAVNLNSWLRDNGYLYFAPGAEIGPLLPGRRLDPHPRLRLGLSGLYLNLQGRESQGIVRPGREAEALERKLIGRLSGLTDTEHGVTAISTRLCHPPSLPRPRTSTPRPI